MERAVFFTSGSDQRLTSGFTQVPNCIIRSPALSAGAKILYQILLSYAWRRDTCYPDQATLAKDAGCTERNVRRWLNELQERDLVRVHQRGLQRPNLYELLPLPDRTILSGQDRTSASAPERTDLSAEEYSGEEYSGEQQHIESESLGDRPAPEVGPADPDAAAADPASPVPVPESEAQPQDAAIAAPPAEAAVAAMVAVGVAEPVAQALAAHYPADVIRRQVKYLPHRDPVDPAAMLVEAIRGNWSDPRLRRNRAPRRRVASQAAYKPSDVDWANEPPL